MNYMYQSSIPCNGHQVMPPTLPRSALPSKGTPLQIYTITRELAHSLQRTPIQEGGNSKPPIHGDETFQNDFHIIVPMCYNLRTVSTSALEVFVYIVTGIFTFHFLKNRATIETKNKIIIPVRWYRVRPFMNLAPPNFRTRVAWNYQ